MFVFKIQFCVSYIFFVENHTIYWICECHTSILKSAIVYILSYVQSINFSSFAWVNQRVYLTINQEYHSQVESGVINLKPSWLHQETVVYQTIWRRTTGPGRIWDLFPFRISKSKKWLTSLIVTRLWPNLVPVTTTVLRWGGGNDTLRRT